jgi:hypothetical protein
MIDAGLLQDWNYALLRSGHGFGPACIISTVIVGPGRKAVVGEVFICGCKRVKAFRRGSDGGDSRQIGGDLILLFCDAGQRCGGNEQREDQGNILHELSFSFRVSGESVGESSMGMG